MTPVVIDLTGQRFGRLTVVEMAAERGPAGKVRWICACSCGTTTTAPSVALRTGNTKSCGCLRAEGSFPVLHGHARRGSRDPLYAIWAAMKDRCSNPNNKRWQDYGGRGIRVCGQWAASFEAFLADVGERPTADHSLDRVDNDGNYEPGNVRWSTRSEQARNRRPPRRGPAL